MGKRRFEGQPDSKQKQEHQKKQSGMLSTEKEDTHKITRISVCSITTLIWVCFIIYFSHTDPTNNAGSALNFTHGVFDSAYIIQCRE